MKVYRIKNWHSCGFEVAQNRRAQHALPWVAIPTKHDGKGYRKLMRSTAGGPAVYGCWIILVAVAGKSPIRGALVDDDGPLTAEEISLKTDMPESLVQQTLDFLCTEIGWMEQVEVDSLDELRMSRAPPVYQQSTTGPPPVVLRTGRTRRTDVTNVRPDPDPVPESGPENATGPDGGRRVPDQPASAAASDPDNARSGSVFAAVDPAVLANPERLRGWFVDQLRSSRPVLPDTDAAWEICVAAAVEALSAGTNPCALFANILGKRRHDLISARSLDRARAIIQQHRQNHRRSNRKLQLETRTVTPMVTNTVTPELQPQGE